MAEGPTVSTKHGNVTVPQLAEMQPGMARLMDEYSRRFWALYYAAKARNWSLAKYMHDEMRKLGKIIPVVRPKYAEAMEEFESAYMDSLASAITAEDWTTFEAAYRRAIDGSDAYHDRFAKSFIRFRLPPDPPPLLEFAPDARPPKE